MKYISLLLIPLFLISCDPKDLQKLLSVPLTNADVAKALKQALDLGVGESVDFLSAENGFYSSAYKILLPEEARSVTDKLKIIPGFSNVEEEILKKINKGAEDAAKKATPIFVNAIKQMTFEDAMGILLGEKNAATSYLNRSTYNALYSEFNPVVIASLDKFNARDYWKSAIDKYNSIPFITKVNPDLADHVTTEALEGLFALIAVKELGIRTDISQRTNGLLKRVFAKQD